MLAGFLFTTESAEIFGAGGYPLLEKLRKTFLLGVGGEGYGFRVGRGWREREVTHGALDPRRGNSAGVIL